MTLFGCEKLMWSTWKTVFFLSSPGFLNLGTVGIWGWRILYLGSCPVYCSMFNSIPGLYPLEASSIPPQVCDPPQHLQMLTSVSGGRGEILTWVEYHCSSAGQGGEKASCTEKADFEENGIFFLIFTFPTSRLIPKRLFDSLNSYTGAKQIFSKFTQCRLPICTNWGKIFLRWQGGGGRIPPHLNSLGRYLIFSAHFHYTEP